MVRYPFPPFFPLFYPYVFLFFFKRSLFFTSFSFSVSHNLYCAVLCTLTYALFYTFAGDVSTTENRERRERRECSDS